MSQDERPRERCLNHGASCLSLRECLALILGSGPPGVGALGLADQLLNLPGPGLSPEEQQRAFFTALETSGRPDWRQQLSKLGGDYSGPGSGRGGLGHAALARLLAVFELARRYSDYRLTKPGRPPPAGTSALSKLALARIPSAQRLAAREWLGFIPYHRNRSMGDLCVVESGARTHVNADATELFARILALRPKGFYLAHNHPSGDLRPSPSDLELTDQVECLAQQLGTPLLGHWIVSPGGETELPRGGRFLGPSSKP